MVPWGLSGCEKDPCLQGGTGAIGGGHVHPSMPNTSALLTAILDRTGDALADHVMVARGATATRGLLGRDGMEPGEGLYFPEALFGALHSFGMRFAFDAVYLDRRGRVRRVLHAVRPYRLCPWDLRTVATLELPAGTLMAAGVVVGDTVRLVQTPD